MNLELDIAQIGMISYFLILFLTSLFYSVHQVLGFSFNLLIFSLFAGSGFDRNGILNHYYCTNIDGYEILSILISKLSCELPASWGFYFFLSVIGSVSISLLLTQTFSFYKKFILATYIMALTLFNIGPARQDVCVLLLIATTIISSKYKIFRLTSQLFAILSHKSLAFIIALLPKTKISLPKFIILLSIGLVLIKLINLNENYIAILLLSYIQEREEIYLGQSTAMITAVFYIAYSVNAKYNLSNSKSTGDDSNLLLINISLITSLISLIGIFASEFINLSIFTRYIRIPTIIVPYLLLTSTIKSNKYISKLLYLTIIFKICNSYSSIPEDYFDSSSIYFQVE